MQKEIVLADDLLNDDGTLKSVGYSKTMLVRYNKEKIKKKSRIKEWDYYYISDENFALCLTISNLSYAAVISASVIDFINHSHYDKTSIMFFPKDKNFMPTTSMEGACKLETKDANFVFDVAGGKRVLKGTFKDFYSKHEPKRDLEFDIVIDNIDQDSLVKITPFKNKQHFYYNQKINCMPAEGKFSYKGRFYTYEKLTALATLDWGRGVLPYKSTWLWSSLQAKVGSNSLGFNLGVFGDNSDATENIIYLNGVGHKVGAVDIYIRRNKRKRDYLQPWTLYTDDGRVELLFEPELDRYVPFNALVLAFIPHQVFGRFTGKLILDDGKEITIENARGFAERVVNRW